MMDYLQYWIEFERNCSFRLTKPKRHDSNYRALRPGRPGYAIYGSLHPNGVFSGIETSIGVGVSIMGEDAEGRYHRLEESCKDKITRLQQPHVAGDFPANGPFFRTNIGDAYCFGTRNEKFNPENRAQWREQHEWMCRWLREYHDTFWDCV